MSRPADILLTILLLVVYIPCTFAATNQFRHWYAEFEYTFSTIYRDNCTEEYNTYLAGVRTNGPIDTYQGANPTNQLAEPVVNCILSHTSEFIKSAMASAQVLLGLTPTMLAVLGPTTEETSVLFVVGRRPLLALCLAVGCPAVFPMRSFDNSDPVGILKEREGRLHPPTLKGARESFVMVVQYTLAIMAIFNIAIVSKALGIQVACNFAPQLTYLVLLWAFLILIIHSFGAITLMFRVHLAAEGESNGTTGWIRTQFTPSSKRGLVHIRLIPENYYFTFFSWFTAILAICHVIYGTLVFSSMLFISVRDSLMVIARYMVSVMCCRIILMYELASLRSSFNLAAAEGADVDLRERFQKSSEAHGVTANVDNTGTGRVPGMHTW